ncbi:beta-tubulin cofactor d [Purpureocillium lilacinum]|uniref:Beta-tubulin cofactor d n=1 Tax=Purpureocillium lilacinum TaxID=33203 RepID=A0A179HX82_PURLI|nr:beta-tubulin cofactor d [Purpureocillium lilacinum]OAQ94997.1 beta-tubulin cofactor d [Purpureocillium lilacinum]
MDAPDAELDVKLQKMSGDLLADLDHAIDSLPRKPDGRGGMRVRSYVRTRESLSAITSILDMFQELPQLLDPHLPKWIPFLADAYLEFVQATRNRGPRRGGKSQFLAPLDFAICRILYTFCKVRGEKVIVRFLNAETRYLEVLLSAIEDAEEHAATAQQGDDTADTGRAWQWEQRYIVLLWLSHQLLAPFDLSTISSLDIEDAALPEISGFRWPDRLPGITMRVIPLAIKYLATPGKEKDAAKALLVRVAMRRDMQQLGVLDSLVQWALASLRPPKDGPLESMHFYLGVLSFLAGLLRSSAETSDVDKWLPSIFDAVYGITTADSELSKLLLPLAIVRKMILKVIRSVIVSLLRKTPQDMASTELTETTIGYLLENLSDSDTPVRLAASKALGVITLKLDPEMASQVVEAVLESLNRNVLWTKPAGGSGVKPVRDLSAVNNLEWHGLMLTLSHLLYRRSPPAAQLSDIIHALLLGLSFEQRNTSGGSVGANVRDAACFGIWAIARRYSTEELLAVPTKSVFAAAKSHPSDSSILQVLGTELVTTASLDPAGNIRRGASAALQELIGRHPDTVEQGIAVVQTVDYHAVARRSRAIEEVATNATKLSPKYGEALIDAILGWRGIGDLDAPSRRVVGSAFGVLAAELARSNPKAGLSRLEDSVQLVTQRIQSLVKRQVEERHGLLLCLSSVIDQIPAARSITNDQGPENASLSSALFHKILANVSQILEDCGAVEYRKPELIAEAASQVVVSSVPALQATLLPDLKEPALQKGQDALSSQNGVYLRLVDALDGTHPTSTDVDAVISKLRAVIPAWLSKSEPEATDPASRAALVLLIFSSQEDRVPVTGFGYFQALALAQPLAALGTSARVETTNDVACEAILERWRSDPDVDTRSAILQSLILSNVFNSKPLTFLGLLKDGLNDYTTNARGDIGSHVRVQALRAVRVLWRNLGDQQVGRQDWVEESIKTLFHSTLRLAAEKLDRVRPVARSAVAMTLKQEHAKRFQSLGFSSKGYFEALLQLIAVDCMHPWLAHPARADASAWMAELLAGYVTSADTGNDDLVIASRTALTDFCEATSGERLSFVCAALMQNLRSRQGEDRVVVPTLEIVAFLFNCGLFQRCRDVDLRALCLQTQKASYKSGNVRKIMACVKVYGGVASMSLSDGGEEGGSNGGAAVQEARRRLGALLFHPWPRVRSVVVDELWGLTGGFDVPEADGAVVSSPLTGVDWAKADKAMIRGVVQELGLA